MRGPPAYTGRMAIAFIFVGVLAVFTISFASPDYGEKIKRLVKRAAIKVHAWFEDTPNLIRKISQSSVRLTNKVLHRSIDKGTKARHKAPF